MPELPEVETMVRGVRPYVEGRPLIDVRLPRCLKKPISLTPDMRAIRKQCVGQVVSRVFRRAKRIVIELESGHSFLIEPRMTGLLLVADPPTVDHLRFEWRLDGSDFPLLFWDRRGLGTISFVDAAGRDEVFSRLGPDALEVTINEFKTRLKKTGRPVKVALLDQKLVSGIGNLYASEILHLAGVHPETPSEKLTAARISRIHGATQEVLLTAIKYEGSTLSDGTYRNVLNQDGSYQNQHRVYDREGLPCPSCSTGTIERIVQAQRSTFFCRKCQRRR
ncbi:MAG: bifunctional DNA-formamidopyrimidine glycosylase/DNA-(apurinic or apyrimidinic site) lyase [Planctomycetaceae bacterium]